MLRIFYGVIGVYEHIGGELNLKIVFFHCVGVLNGAPICTESRTTFIFGNKYWEPPC